MPRPIVQRARVLLPFGWAAFSLKYLLWPWTWALLGAALGLLLEARRQRGSRSSVVWFNAGICLAVVALFESALSFFELQ